MGRGSAAASCTTRGLHASAAEPSRLVKAAWKDGPEMKHIPLSLGLCLQKRRGKFICTGVKPYSSSLPIATRSKVCRLPPRQTRHAVVPGPRGHWGSAVPREMQSDGDPILSFWPRVTLTSPWPEGWGRPMAKALQQECLNTHQGRNSTCPDVFSMSCCARSRILFGKPQNTAPGQRAAGAGELAAQDGLCRVSQLVKTAATAGRGRTDSITRVGLAAPQQRPSFCPGNLSYKPQLENGKKKWRYETMA